MVDRVTTAAAYALQNSKQGFWAFAAEVLGHELAHAVWILGDLERARMVEEMIEQTNESFLSQSRKHGYANLKPEMRQRIAKRDILLLELEAQAEAIELLVWQEILRSREVRARNRNQKAFDLCGWISTATGRERGCLN